MIDAHQERAVAQGLRAGRLEAWQALHAAFAEPVWRCVARRLGPNADVADVVQETFLAAARSAANFDPERGSLWLWLWGIARRHAALHQRKSIRNDRLATEIAAVVRWLDSRSPEPPEALQSAEMAELVRNTLAGLSPEYETLLAGKYLDGETVESLALKLGASREAVRSKLARARQAFRAAFAKYVDDRIEATQ